MNTRSIRAKYPTKRSTVASVGLVIANNPLGVFILMGLFLLAISGAYWQANGMRFNIKGFSFNQALEDGVMSAEARAALSSKRINRKFIMGGVRLGMTQAMVKDIHPNAQITTDRAGEPVITIPTHNGIMVAWLFQDDDVITVSGVRVRDDTKRIYRLRLDEAHATLSEHDILKRYGSVYGRPLEATCTRAGLGDTPRCAYRWWGGDGIELLAIAKGKSDLYGRDYTQLTTIATNTIKSPKVQTVRLSSLPSLRGLASN